VTEDRKEMKMVEKEKYEKVNRKRNEIGLRS
jgi:hypothetical protein